MHHAGIYLVAVIVGVFVISSLVKSALEQAAMNLSAEIRERISVLEENGLIWWQSVDILGSALILCGLLKAYGVFPAFRDYGPWGIPSIALGLLSICIASSVRAWLIRGYYQAEAPNTLAQNRASRAAWITCAAELSLGAVVCGWIFVPLMTMTPIRRSAAPGVALAQPIHVDDDLANKTWVNQTEALKLLPGKDARYLKRLVAEGEVKSKEENNETVYQRNHIVKTVEAGLPIYDDQDEGDELSPAPSQPARAPESKVAEPAREPQAAPKQSLKED